MIIEGFIAALLILKALGFIDLTWTVTAVVCVALFVVEVRIYLNKRATYETINNVAREIGRLADRRFSEVELELGRKQNRDYDEPY